MTLRKKTFVILSVTIVTLMAGLYAVSRFIMLNSFVALEEQDMHKQVERFLATLTEDLTSLNRTVGDWAPWDDSYTFIEDVNAAYISNNLNYASLANLRINLLLYRHASGRLIFSTAIDLRQELERPIPPATEAFLLHEPLLTEHPATENNVTGIVLSPEGPLLLASQPIITSDHKGPIRGALIMGRYLNEDEIGWLTNITHLSTTMYPVGAVTAPPDVQHALTTLSKDAPVLIHPLSETMIAGYALVNDIHGQPGLVFRIDFPRAIYQQGQTSIRYFLGYLLASGAVLGLIILWLLERVILSRLAGLNKGVNQIRTGQDLSRRVAVTGQDELASLATATNQMLAALQASEAELRQHQEHLEELVTERTRELTTANTLLREAKEAAELANRAKTSFLASMSHELRTPLNGILGFTPLLLADPTLPERRRQTIEHIHQNGEHLLMMISDLLDITTIESQQIALAPGEFQLGNALRKVIEPQRREAEGRHLTLQVEGLAALPPFVYGDEKRLQQVLRHLLSNAIKFTARGGVTLRVKNMGSWGVGEMGRWNETPQRPTPPSPHLPISPSSHLRFEVTDTGCGIPPEHLQKIFEVFHHVKDQHFYSEGAGVGLSISQRLIRLMGGELHVASTVNQGSVFWFEIGLPVVPDEAAPPPETADSAPIRETLAPVIPPSAEELAQLVELALMGDVDSLQSRAHTLAAQDGQLAPFCRTLAQLAEDFRIDEIQQFLKQYQ